MTQNTQNRIDYGRQLFLSAKGSNLTKLLDDNNQPFGYLVRYEVLNNDNSVPQIRFCLVFNTDYTYSELDDEIRYIPQSKIKKFAIARTMTLKKKAKESILLSQQMLDTYVEFSYINERLDNLHKLLMEYPDLIKTKISDIESVKGYIESKIMSVLDYYKNKPVQISFV